MPTSLLVIFAVFSTVTMRLPFVASSAGPCLFASEPASELPTASSRPRLLEVERKAFAAQQAAAGQAPKVPPTAATEGTSLVDHLRLVMDQPIRDVAFSGDGRWCAALPLRADNATGDHEILLYDLTDTVKPPLHFVSAARPTAMALSHFGARLFIGTEEGRVTAWDVRSRQMVCESILPTHMPIRQIAPSPGGTFAAVAFGRVLIVDVENDELLRCDATFGDVRTIALSHDGTWLAVGFGAIDLGEPTGSTTCLVISLVSAQSFAVGDGQAPPAALVFDPDQPALMMVDQRERVFTWDAQHGPTWREPAGDIWPGMLTIAPDSAHAASISRGTGKHSDTDHNRWRTASFIHEPIQITDTRNWDDPALMFWQLGPVVGLRFVSPDHLMVVTRSGKLFNMPVSYPRIASTNVLDVAQDAVAFGPDELDALTREYLDRPLKDLSPETLGDMLVLLASARIDNDAIAAKNRRDTIERLMSYGAGINHRAGEARWTALHWAAFTDDVELAGYLLELGADFAIADAKGRPMLEIAALARSQRILKMFDFFD